MAWQRTSTETGSKFYFKVDGNKISFQEGMHSYVFSLRYWHHVIIIIYMGVLGSGKGG
jgi:hypothetical protein